MLALKEIQKKDCDLLYKWANEEEVRSNSFNTNKINYKDHLKWFEEILNSKTSTIYLLEDNNKKIGMIRLDKHKKNEYIINYSISKEHRKKGYATKLLKLIKDVFPEKHLIGKVKKTNIGSIKAFLNAEYIIKEEQDSFVFYSKKFQMEE